MTSQLHHPDDLQLPRQPGVIRQFWGRHPRLADWLITLFWGFPALLVTVVTYAYPGRDTTPSRPFTLIAGAAIVVACLGFFLRRSRPLTALGFFCVALIPSVFAEVGPGQVLPVFGVYALAVYRSNIAAWVAAGALELGSTLLIIAGSPFRQSDSAAANPVQWVFVYGFELVIGLLIGTTIGARRRYLDALIDRAHQLARERDQQAQLSAIAERARIARDMHDVVSHSLTVMVALADGSAIAAETDARRAAEAMRQVADTGREALTGMRRMLGVLGDDEPAALSPQPTAAEVPALVARFRSLGLPVELRTDGEVPDDPAVQLAVYRIVQEGLTNALRYAHGPTRVSVRLDAEADPLAVLVEDDGLPGIPTPSVGAGRGLVGLTERVQALGGTLATGPRDGGAGWSLAAALPLTPTGRPNRKDTP